MLGVPQQHDITPFLFYLHEILDEKEVWRDVRIFLKFITPHQGLDASRR